MNILLKVASLLFITASSGAPPHAPNFCGQTFCLELQPMLHTERKGFVTAQKDLLELDGRSWMRLKYADLGTVSVFGPLTGASETNSASYHEIAEEIVVNSCMSDSDSKTCNRYLISISDNGVAKKPLVCSLASFWPAKAEENSPDVRLGERIDVTQQLTKRCL